MTPFEREYLAALEEQLTTSVRGTIHLLHEQSARISAGPGDLAQNHRRVVKLASLMFAAAQRTLEVELGDDWKAKAAL